MQYSLYNKQMKFRNNGYGITNVTVQHYNVYFSDVVGAEQAKEALLSNFIDPIRRRHLYRGKFYGDLISVCPGA